MNIAALLENKLAALASSGVLIFIIATAALSAALGSFLSAVSFNFGAGRNSYNAKASTLKFIGGSIVLALILGVAGNYLSKMAGI